MAITFRPKRGAILVCDFDMARVPPEFDKPRFVAVISVLEMNHRHGLKPGRCTVVPFSTVPPQKDNQHDIYFKRGSYRTLTEECWAICNTISTVSHDRLDLAFYKGRRAPSEMLTEADLARIATGVRFSLGLD